MTRSSGPHFGRRRRAGRWRAPLWIALLLLAGFLLAGWLRPHWFLAAEFVRQRWLAGASEHAIVVDGQRWNYLQAGEGRPLVLLHGFTGNKEGWLPIVAALAEDYRVLVPELPGWGLLAPDAPRPPYGYAADAARLAGFLAAVAPGERIDLVGHSMGGGIAAVYAARYPERLDRLVLMSAAGVAFDNAFARAVLAGEHPFRVGNRAELDAYLGLVFEDPPWLPWPADRAVIRRRMASEAFERQVLAAVSTGPEAGLPSELAASIEAPTLLLWCRADPVIDVAAAGIYAKTIARTQTLLLDGCAHMPMMERPAATVAALRAFLHPQSP
jgi:abhydrolase domain-containing protein 6